MKKASKNTDRKVGGNFLMLNLIFIYLFEVLHCFQLCTGHITTGSCEGRGNQDIQLVKVLYCKLPTIGKRLPTFPLEVGPGTKPQSQRLEARVLPLYHRGPMLSLRTPNNKFSFFRVELQFTESHPSLYILKAGI